MPRVVAIALLCTACQVIPGQSEGAIANPEPAHDSLALHRQVCTGRNFREPACADYELRLRSDGAVRWEGYANVAAIGVREQRVAPRAVAKLHRRLARALPRLAELTCAVDHTHYVTITIGREGDPQAHTYRGCGARFRRLARPLDRVARIDDLR